MALTAARFEAQRTTWAWRSRLGGTRAPRNLRNDKDASSPHPFPRPQDLIQHLPVHACPSAEALSKSALLFRTAEHHTAPLQPLQCDYVRTDFSEARSRAAAVQERVDAAQPVQSAGFTTAPACLRPPPAVTLAGARLAARARLRPPRCRTLWPVPAARRGG